MPKSPVESPNAAPLPLVEQLAGCCKPFGGEPISLRDAEVTAAVFKALADPARVRLLSMIALGDPAGTCVCDLNASLELSQPTVSHHLKVMLDAGLLERERRASWAYYRLRPGALATLAGVFSR